MMDKFDVLDVNRIQSERIAELEARIKELHETIAGQLATITALTVGTEGSTPAIVQMSRLEARIAELEIDASLWCMLREKCINGDLEVMSGEDPKQEETTQ